MHGKDVKKIMADIKGVHEQMPKKGQKVWMLCLHEVYYHEEDSDHSGSYWESLPGGERMALGWSPHE